MGSGTTAEACVNAKRQWLGSEIDEKCLKLVELRLKNA
jgi:DNA modification methylase